MLQVAKHRGSFNLVDEEDVQIVNDVEVDETVVSKPEWDETLLNYEPEAA